MLNRLSAIASIGMLLFAALGVPAQEVQQVNWGRRIFCPPPCPPVSPYAPSTPPTTPPTTPPSPTEPPMTSAFAQAGEGGTMPSASFMPAMFGDLVGFSSTRFLLVGIPDSASTRVPITVPGAGSVSGFKVADHESPRPVNRIYYAFNYFDDVNRSINPVAPFFAFRHTLGFEKTFLGGDASFGMRVPFAQLTPTSPLSNSNFFIPENLDDFQQGGLADLSIILKYAIINNPPVGNVLSGGLVITVPTGAGFVTDTVNPNGVVTQTSFHPAMIQPWAGYIYNLMPRLYMHGFSSIIVPFDSRVPTIFANDIGLGLWLYRNAGDRFVQGIVPTCEVHINNPLTNRGTATQPIGMQDQVNLTGGAYLILPRSTFGFAMGVPLAGPKPYDFETIASYTLRF